MAPLLLILALGVFAYLWWKWRFTSLTRDCRWRQDRAAGDWVCAACDARTTTENGRAPRVCLRKR